MQCTGALSIGLLSRELLQAAVPADVPRASKISDAILEKIKRATAFIEGRNGTGTAFVVAPGILVTNNHVLQDEYIARHAIAADNANRVVTGLQSERLCFSFDANRRII